MGNRGSSKKSTEEIIADSFKELALTIPIEKITIQEIADNAGVIRATFYNHFEDKYDLLKWIINRELMIPVHPMFEGGFFHEGLVILFTNARKNKSFYSQAARLDGVISFESIIEGMIVDKLLEFIMVHIDETAMFNKWFTTRNLAEYYAKSMCFVAMKWVKSGMKAEPSEVAEVYKIIISHSLEEMLHQFESDASEQIIPRYISLQ